MRINSLPASLTTASACLAEFWLCDSLRADPEEFRKAKRLAILSLAFLFWVTLFAVVYVALGSIRCGGLTLWTALPILGGLLLLKHGRSSNFCGNTITTSGWLTLSGLAMLNGGLSGPSLLWYTVLPVVAVLTSGLLAGLAWTLVCVASLVGFAVAEALGVVFPQELAPTSLSAFWFAALLGLAVCQFVMAAVRVVIEQRALAAMRDLKQELNATRKQLARLEESRGYSFEEWATLKREHAALTRFVRFKYGQLESDAALLDSERDDAWDEDDLDEQFADELMDELSDDDVAEIDLLDNDLTDADLDEDDDDHGHSSRTCTEPDLATLALQAILRRRP